VGGGVCCSYETGHERGGGGGGGWSGVDTPSVSLSHTKGVTPFYQMRLSRSMQARTSDHKHSHTTRRDRRCLHIQLAFLKCRDSLDAQVFLKC